MRLFNALGRVRDSQTTNSHSPSTTGVSKVEEHPAVKQLCDITSGGVPAHADTVFQIQCGRVEWRISLTEIALAKIEEVVTFPPPEQPADRFQYYCRAGLHAIIREFGKLDWPVLTLKNMHENDYIDATTRSAESGIGRCVCLPATVHSFTLQAQA